jgi:hypothetical protein
MVDKAPFGSIKVSDIVPIKDPKLASYFYTEEQLKLVEEANKKLREAIHVNTQVTNWENYKPKYNLQIRSSQRDIKMMRC